jgi:hypothetical protein
VSQTKKVPKDLLSKPKTLQAYVNIIFFEDTTNLRQHNFFRSKKNNEKLSLVSIELACAK